MLTQEEQNNLRNKYNPDGSELRNLQLRMLDILKYVDGICKTNNLQYWLSSGTCIGAIRHGGFIPWDDDIDIEMLDEDYEQLMKILKEESKKPDVPYTLQDHTTDKFYYLRFAKLREKKSEFIELGPDRQFELNGIPIDIFCLTKSSSRKIHSLGLYIQNIISQRFPKYYNIRGCKFFLNMAARLIAGVSACVLNYLQKIGKKKYYRTKSPCYFHAGRDLKEIFPLRTVLFEGCEFYVPNNYDAYLTKMFGDWITLPPKEKRQSHHYKSLRF